MNRRLRSAYINALKFGMSVGWFQDRPFCCYQPNYRITYTPTQIWSI